MFRMNGMSRWHGRQGATMFRMNGMSQWHGCQRATMFRINHKACCLKQASLTNPTEQTVTIISSLHLLVLVLYRYFPTGTQDDQSDRKQLLLGKSGD